MQGSQEHKEERADELQIDCLLFAGVCGMYNGTESAAAHG